jgi:hypothetical protein
LKSDKVFLPHEQLKLSIHITDTGLASESRFLTDIDVSKNLTLSELKDILLDFVKSEKGTENLRVRDRCSNGFFGKIYRESSKTLK